MSKASIVSLSNTFLLVVFLTCELTGFIELPPFFSYNTHKFWHLVGVYMFLGNVAVGPIWVLMAIRSKDQKILSYAFSMLLLTDIVITIPGIDLIIINGLAMGRSFGGVVNNPWLLHSVLSLFALWVLVYPILRIQDKMQFLVQGNQQRSQAFKVEFKKWLFVGAMSMVPVSYIVFLMVYKTTLF